jgi:hypothetical protein
LPLWRLPGFAPPRLSSKCSAAAAGNQRGQIKHSARIGIPQDDAIEIGRSIVGISSMNLSASRNGHDLVKSIVTLVRWSVVDEQ